MTRARRIGWSVAATVWLLATVAASGLALAVRDGRRRHGL